MAYASLPEPINYSAAAPNYLGYFQAGQQAVQNSLDQQYQAQTRAALVEQQQRKAQLDTLLGPLDVQQKQVNLDQSKADLDLFNQNRAPLPYLGPGGVTESTITSQTPTAPTSPYVNSVGPDASGIFSGTATVFGGPKDKASFDRAKAAGATDLQALAVGDNGVGAWGANTADPSKKYVAVSPDFMAANRLKPNDPITVMANGRSSLAYVGDKLPNHSKNGAVIDLNPGVAADLGVDPDGYKGAVTFKIGHDATASKGLDPTGKLSDPDYLKAFPDAAVHLGGAIPVSGDGGILDRALAVSKLANPATAGLTSSGAPNSPVVSPFPPVTDSALLASGVSPMESLNSPPFTPIAAQTMPKVFAPIGNGQPVTGDGSGITASRGPQQYGPGFIDPSTGVATFGTRQEAQSLHVPYGMVSKPAPNPAQAKNDLALAKAAPKGYEGDTTLGPNGELTQDQRDGIRAAQKDAAAHKGTVLPKSIIAEAVNFNVPTDGKSADEVAQEIEDKQVQTGQIPPRLLQTAQQIVKGVDTNKVVQHYVNIKQAKEAFDSGYSNQDTGGFGDMAMNEGIQRMINPGASVRTQTMQMMMKAAGFAQDTDLSYLLNHFTQGDKYSPEVRDKLKKLADNIYDRSSSSAQPFLQQVKKRAQVMGVKNADALTDAAIGAFVSPDAGLDPSPNSPENGGNTVDAGSRNGATPTPHPDAIPAGKIVTQKDDKTGQVNRYQKQPDGSFKQL